jgi:DNA polymerase (family 10)
MDKHAAAHTLEQIASFLELNGDNEFRVRAFRNAAHAIASFAGDFDDAVRSGALGDTKGVGPATLEVVRELALSGRSTTLEDLKRDVPEGLVEMLRIAGLGVTRIRVLHAKLAITTVAELEVAARDGRLADLPRFGRKTAEKILRGIGYLRRTGDFHLLHHALRQAEPLVRAVRELPGITAAEITGSVRRRCELVRDIDIAVASDAGPRAVAEWLAVFRGVRDVVGAGDATFAVHFETGITTKVWVGTPANFGHLLVRTTGNRAHLASLLEVASGRDLVLDSQGLSWKGAPLPCADEAAFYSTLGLSFVPPELREGTGEVALAAVGALPRLVERADLKGFVHCHTEYSDGANTVAEIAAACHAAGYEYVGITDHSEASAYAGGLSKDALLRQHAEIDAYNRTSLGIRVLKGIEADILENGTLDYDGAFLDRFDFVIASIHTRFEMDEKAMTKRVLKAMDDPHLAIMGHPTGRLLLDRDPYPIDMAKVIARAADRGVAIEINADPQRLDMGWQLCREAKAAGVRIPISADAHNVAGLANVDLGIGVARKAGLTKDDVLNSRDVEGFLDHAHARRR